MSERAATSPNLTDRGRIPSILRFATELIAWITVPWALAGDSIVLAVIALILLIGLPTVFSTVGDKKQVMVAAPGWVTIALVVLQFVAAVWGAWQVWPVWSAVLVTVLAATAAIAEIPRWRWLVGV
ncbi:hypothetical protein ABZ942_15860 [Nocardia sp. NPDC046473]|uniref:hypothetical protein n=1 Tax=Nocardia sp. NPDC046473 TaxID=3155733 RepID=UPI0033FA318A